MKKRLSALLILPIALFAAAPYVTGKIAESETMKMVDTMKLDTTSYGDIDVLSYERSYRSTSAKYRYTLPTTLAAILQIKGPIVYGCESQHGVLGIDYVCHLQGENAYRDFVNDKLAGKDPFSMYGSVSAFGAITQTYEFNAIKDFDLEGQLVTTPNALLSIETDNKMSAFKFKGGTESFKLKDEEGRLDVGTMTFDGDMTSIAEMVLTGSFNLSLDTLRFKSDETRFSLSDFTVSSVNHESGDNINSKGVLTLGSMDIADNAISRIDNVNVAVELNGVDTDAFSEYQAFAMNIQQQALVASDAGQAPPVDPNSMLAMLPMLERMLKAGLALNLDAKAKLNGSDNTFQLGASLVESLTLAEMGIFVVAPEQALKKLDINIDTQLANALVDTQPMLAEMLSQSPLIEKSNDHYTLAFSSNKSIQLNGKTITFDELQELVFGSLSL